jgi:hypothetical protein
MVNRIWHYHFGTGIVATPSDFGLMGERPTHPDLLDWLAAEFVASGWSMKHLHRLIVTSNTYRQTSTHRQQAAEADPRNSLLWRFPRFRLDAEVIRDSALSAAGLLDTTIGGPSVYPRLPEGLTAEDGPQGNANWGQPTDENRRSVYVFVRRNLRYPMLEVMDFPDTHETCSRRQTTTTAPQALTFLNSAVILEWGQAFAGKVLREAGPDLNAEIDHAYLRAYARRPNASEKDTALAFFSDQKAILADRLANGEPLAPASFVPDGVDPLQATALVDFCHMLINSNEFVYAN